MSDEITAAAASAGAIDPAEISVLIPAGGAESAMDQVAALKAAKPYLFRPAARAMSPAEYTGAKAEFFKSEKQRQRQAADAADIARATHKFKQ
jgi:hypothetical protein